MYWTSEDCTVELKISKSEAGEAAHRGSCDTTVEALSLKPRIARQLNKLTPAQVRAALEPYGAWEDDELKDHAQNLQRLLWCACCDINDGSI